MPAAGAGADGPARYLPPLAVLTDRRQAAHPLPEVIASAVDGGARLVILREKDLPDVDRARLAGQLLEILHPVGGRLVLASRVPGNAFGCGVHLAAVDPYPADPPGLVGRSCHALSEVRRAAQDGVHYATLSPIFASRSKPGYGPQLGQGVFRASVPIPVYALGGVESPDRAVACLAAGAFGVAVMGTVMRAPDPGHLVSELLGAIRRCGANGGRASGERR